MAGTGNNGSSREARQHIMAVDDEQDILRVIRSGLTRYGHSVVAFSDPLVALEELVHHRQDYVLLLTDIRMPGMTGLELAKKARDLDPQLKILVMTAFELSEYDLSQKLPFIKIQNVLKKPVILSKMCQVIDKHLVQ